MQIEKINPEHAEHAKLRLVTAVKNGLYSLRPPMIHAKAGMRTTKSIRQKILLEKIRITPSKNRRLIPAQLIRESTHAQK
ncbi:MAG: hypothetical protein ACLU8W_06900 [Clostridia bacterium]